MNDYEYCHASQNIILERNRIAERVRRELQLAGLPAFLAEGEADRMEGAAISVDSGADAAGGVFVNWKCDLSRAAARSLRAGNVQAPVIKQSGTVSQHM